MVMAAANLLQVVTDTNSTSTIALGFAGFTIELILVYSSFHCLTLVWPLLFINAATT